MSATPKFCRDCRWCKKTSQMGAVLYHADWLCIRTVNDLVSGEAIDYRLRCTDERMPGAACGPTGLLFLHSAEVLAEKDARLAEIVNPKG